MPLCVACALLSSFDLVNVQSYAEQGTCPEAPLNGQAVMPNITSCEFEALAFSGEVVTS